MKFRPAAFREAQASLKGSGSPDAVHLWRGDTGGGGEPLRRRLLCDSSRNGSLGALPLSCSVPVKPVPVGRTPFLSHPSPPQTWGGSPCPEELQGERWGVPRFGMVLGILRMGSAHRARRPPGSCDGWCSSVRCSEADKGSWAPGMGWAGGSLLLAGLSLL